MQYVIVGGGIAGLFCAYSLHKKLNIKNIIVIEKNNRLGGRIYTKYIGSNTSIELGAGAIVDVHFNVLSLINELGLSNKLKKMENPRIHLEFNISSNECYADYEINKITRLDQTNFYDIFKKLNDKLNDKQFYKMATNFSLLRLIEKIYGINKANEMKNQFGYDGDFIFQNAIDGIKMFNKSFKKNAVYYRLEGGLSQIIDELSKYLTNNSIQIQLNTECTDIIQKNDKYICILNNNKEIISDNIIFAVPKVNLIKIKYLNNIKSIFNTIINKSLIRIYVFFPLIDNHVWFENINNIITTQTLFRQIIPVNKQKGIIMIYADSEAAKTLYFLKKTKELKKELTYQFRRLFNNTNIPEPIKIYSHYWDTATHIWKPSFNSEQISKKIIKPYENKNIFILGEGFSLTQQWSEGALETVNDFINMFLK